jgi:hypothetical protein
MVMAVINCGMAVIVLVSTAWLAVVKIGSTT